MYKNMIHGASSTFEFFFSPVIGVFIFWGLFHTHLILVMRMTLFL